ncbi:unnamed protein product [Ambrosiozyma monospora]|uniref:Unnamed protein product n=1 Tax=Ambrosiozyma monospora TaxID=43982 RepID=A0ACB5SSD1_AMBMO|nr:unnamed protein product [Ambrosiozyma monospora]
MGIAQNSGAQTYADALEQADYLLKVGSAEAPFDGNLLEVASIPFVNVTERVDDFSDINPLQVPLDYYKDPTNADVDTISDMMLHRLPSVDDEDAQEFSSIARNRFDQESIPRGIPMSSAQARVDDFNDNHMPPTVLKFKNGLAKLQRTLSYVQVDHRIP